MRQMHSNIEVDMDYITLRLHSLLTQNALQQKARDKHGAPPGPSRLECDGVHSRGWAIPIINGLMSRDWGDCLLRRLTACVELFAALHDVAA